MKRRLIVFLSAFILTATLAGSALAVGNPPGNSPPAGKPEVRSACRQKKGSFDTQKARAFVDGLVADNVIPRETGDQLLAYFDQKREEHKTERDKLKSMTEEERKAYLEERKAKRAADGPFSELVQNGTLTKEQAKAIAQALREYVKK